MTRMELQSGRKMFSQKSTGPVTPVRNVRSSLSIHSGSSTIVSDDESSLLPRERDIHDPEALLQPSLKEIRRPNDMVPVSESFQKLFGVLQDTQAIVENLEKQNDVAQLEIRQSREALREAKENLRLERRRATLAENRLREHLSPVGKSGMNDRVLKLLAAFVDLVGQEATDVNKAYHEAMERLANASESVHRLTLREELLKNRYLTALLEDE